MNQNVKILIVDDDPNVIFDTSRIVKKAGHQVFIASNARDCFDSARTNLPDMILIDAVMPDIEGSDLCRRIKEVPELKSIFVVLTSGIKTSSVETANELDADVDGYLVRPTSNRELEIKVNAMVQMLMAKREQDPFVTIL
jgi:DNA-binding response OmpR family regulator